MRAHFFTISEYVSPEDLEKAKIISRLIRWVDGLETHLETRPQDPAKMVITVDLNGILINRAKLLKELGLVRAVDQNEATHNRGEHLY